MTRRGGRPRRRPVTTIEFPATIDFATEQAAADFVASIDEVRSKRPDADCACSFARDGRLVTVAPESDEHARKIAVELVRKGWLKMSRRARPEPGPSFPGAARTL